MDLPKLRHSLANLLAAAVLALYPRAKNAIGQAIEDGFYYDFEFEKPISEKELSRIEKKMRQLVKQWAGFSSQQISAREARKLLGKNRYKLELIDELEQKGGQITICKSGNFTDLCRGGHIKDVNQLKKAAFKLDRLAGAYWQRSEKNPMLTRIYGLAFGSKKDLNKYLKIREQAKARDHKKLGPELDLFTWSDLVGAGLPLWTPKGALLRHLLDDLVWQLRKERGYQKVEIPHLAKKELYLQSGHWDKFHNELFKVNSREDHEFVIKPMNCPHHIEIFKRRMWSWRQLPQRYANTTMCYRDEQSGELAGLSRTRGFTQDDAHVFCRQHQVKQEFEKIWDIVNAFYKAVGLFPLKVRLSLHDPNTPEKFLGSKEIWQRAEKELKAIAQKRKVNLIAAVGEAAFYGPKIDFLANDSLGREWQVATIQLDMNLPERFNLYCINEKGQKERLVIIHAAIMGSLERFLSILIEHFAGAFPYWLAPEQVWVIPISEKQNKYASQIAQALEQQNIRLVLKDDNETLAKKIRQGQIAKIPYLLVVGEKEAKNETVSVRQRVKGDLGSLKLADFLSKISKEKS